MTQKKRKSAVVLENLNVSISGSEIISDVSFSVSQGAFHTVIGHSGAGKTTLLKTIAGIIPFQSGTMYMFGSQINRKQLRSIGKRVGYIPQNMGLVESLSVRQNILIGSLGRVSSLKSVLGFFPKSEQAYTDELLAMLKLKDKQDQAVYTLSGGEKRRVAIARALMKKPDLLLADEFLSDLDFALAGYIVGEIKKLQKKYDLTVIMVEHDLSLVQSLSTHVSFMRGGSLIPNIAISDINPKKLHTYFE